MRVPTIPKKPKWRVSQTGMWCILIVAFTFDLMQLFPKILIGLTMPIVAGVSWIPLFGQVIAVVAVGLSIAVDMALSALILCIAYLTIFLMFQHRDVPIVGGQYMGRKMALSMLTIIAEVFPFVNAIPSITLFAAITIFLSRKEDLVRHTKAVARAKLHIQRLRAQHEAERAYYDAVIAREVVGAQAEENATLEAHRLERQRRLEEMYAYALPADQGSAHEPQDPIMTRRALKKVDYSAPVRASA
jgi:hypothetical protein